MVLSVYSICVINLVFCVVDVLNQASNWRLHQYKERELPREIHHQGNHPHRLDECPQQHVDIQAHCSSHQVGVFRQPRCDFTYTEDE